MHLDPSNYSFVQMPVNDKKHRKQASTNIANKTIPMKTNDARFPVKRPVTQLENGSDTDKALLQKKTALAFRYVTKMCA